MSTNDLTNHLKGDFLMESINLVWSYDFPLNYSFRQNKTEINNTINTQFLIDWRY